jgi:hypothetical protein
MFAHFTFQRLDSHYHLQKCAFLLSPLPGLAKFLICFIWASIRQRFLIVFAECPSNSREPASSRPLHLGQNQLILVISELVLESDEIGGSSGSAQCHLRRS